MQGRGVVAGVAGGTLPGMVVGEGGNEEGEVQGRAAMPSHGAELTRQEAIFCAGGGGVAKPHGQVSSGTGVVSHATNGR